MRGLDQLCIRLCRKCRSNGAVQLRPALRKQLLVATTACSWEKRIVGSNLQGRLTGICRSEDLYESWWFVVNVESRFVNPEWTCSVGLMSLVTAFHMFGRGEKQGGVA